MPINLVEATARLKARSRRSGSASATPVFWLVTDQARLPDPAPLLRRLPPGSGVLLRLRDPVGREQAARRLLPQIRGLRLVLSVSADPALATRLGLGLHLPEAMARAGTGSAFRLARRRRRLKLTVATHGPAALARAARLGADCALLSPVYPTESHPGAPPLGRLRFARWARSARLPVCALGGMTASRAATLRFAHGFAAVSLAPQTRG